MTDKYVSPLSERYASRDMQYIFSPDMNASGWSSFICAPPMPLKMSPEKIKQIIQISMYAAHRAAASTYILRKESDLYFMIFPHYLGFSRILSYPDFVRSTQTGTYPGRIHKLRAAGLSRGASRGLRRSATQQERSWSSQLLSHLPFAFLACSRFV